MHNIPTYLQYHSNVGMAGYEALPARLRPEPRAARAGDMESALYGDSVWSVYGHIVCMGVW